MFNNTQNWKEIKQKAREVKIMESYVTNDGTSSSTLDVVTSGTYKQSYVTSGIIAI
jgi:hypothetical protein